MTTFRSGTPADATACGELCYHAFCGISRAHNFPPDFPEVAIAHGFAEYLLSSPNIYSVLAWEGSKLVGCNFLWENQPVFGIGPICVDPGCQSRSLGRKLMEAVLQRTEQQKAAGVRLVQAAFNCTSLSLYTKLGFDPREPLACMNGSAQRASIPGRQVRKAEPSDLPACDALCRRIHGFARSVEVANGIQHGTAWVVEQDGRITGYTAGLGFMDHTLGESNDDLKALIGSGLEIAGPGFLLPMRNADLFRWCLNQGLRVVQPMTLMSQGLYNEPAGAFMPSILF